MQQFQEFLFLSSLKCLNELMKYRAAAMHKLKLLFNRAPITEVQKMPFSGPWRCFVPQDHLSRSLWPRSPRSQPAGAERQGGDAAESSTALLVPGKGKISGNRAFWRVLGIKMGFITRFLQTKANCFGLGSGSPCFAARQAGRSAVVRSRDE